MDVVVECGGAPGAWTQVLTQIIGKQGQTVRKSEVEKIERVCE